MVKMATMHSFDVVHGQYAPGIQLSVHTGIQYWFFEVLGLFYLFLGCSGCNNSAACGDVLVAKRSIILIKIYFNAIE